MNTRGSSSVRLPTQGTKHKDVLENTQWRSVMYLDSVKENTTKRSQESRFSGQDLNRVYPE
jgi:hypothetical protein